MSTEPDAEQPSPEDPNKGGGETGALDEQPNATHSDASTDEEEGKDSLPPGASTKQG